MYASACKFTSALMVRLPVRRNAMPTAAAPLALPE